MSRHPSRSSLVGSFLLVGCGVAAACGQAEGPSGVSDAPSFGTYPAPSTAPGGAVIATVGPVTFTTAEIEQRLKDLSPFVRMQLEDPSQRLKWVENEIRLETLAQQAWEEGLQNDPEVREQIRQLLIQIYTRRSMQEVAKSAEPNDAELIKAYEARTDEFNKPAKVRLSQIVRYVDSDRERKKARALLERIRAEVVEGQKKNDHTIFAKAARTHSEDEATKLGAGDLQFLTRAQLAERYGPAVADASFDEAKVGDLYVADAPNAVVLFKKTGFRRALERSLEEVRPQLRNQLTQEKRQGAFEAWSTEIMRRSGVSIDEDAVAEIRVPGREPPTPAVGGEAAPDEGDP